VVDPSHGILYQNYPNPFWPMTRIKIVNPRECLAEIRLYDLDDALFDVVFDAVSGPGPHLYAYTPQSGELLAGTRVLRCEFSARSVVGDTLLFQDSIYVVAYNCDAEGAVLGLTDANGVLELADRLQFPCLYALPSMVFTTADDPQPAATFAVSDTFVVVLSDPVSAPGYSQTHEVVVGSGSNSFDLVWDPPAPR